MNWFEHGFVLLHIRHAKLCRRVVRELHHLRFCGCAGLGLAVLNRKGQKRKGLSALHLALEMVAQELLTRPHVALQVALPQHRLGGKIKVFRVHFGLRVENSLMLHSALKDRKRNGNALPLLIKHRGALITFHVIECQRQIHIVTGDS